jgi:hypothetical protein
LNTGSAIEHFKVLWCYHQNNGSPGAGTRGHSWFRDTGNSNPLYIVDGITVGDIDYLNPSDIESIDILKDAASVVFMDLEQPMVSF